MAVLEKAGGFLSARQSYLKAMGLYEAQQRRLFMLFGVGNEADLEAALLQQRGAHADAVAEYNRLAIAFEEESCRYDRAVAAQQQRIARLVDADVRGLDE